MQSSVQTTGAGTPLWKFLSGYFRGKEIDRFRTFYNDQFLRTRKYNKAFRRPSVVAHSFGTFIVGYALLKFPEIKLEKLILCGSILRKDFPWHQLLERDQVRMVTNEYGMKDIPVSYAHWVTRDCGPSGRGGFECEALNFQQMPFEGYTHSDFFAEDHFNGNWLPFLRRPSLQLRLVHSRDVPGADLQRLLNECHEIDKDSYPENFEDATLPRGLSLKWLERNPDLYCFLSNQHNRALGYFGAMPIKQLTFERIKRGELLDNEIKAEDVLPYPAQTEVCVYLMSIAIARDARRRGPGIQAYFDRLAGGLFEKLEQYFIADGVRVTEMCAVAWTEEGEALCKNIMGMTLLIKKGPRHGKPVYGLQLKSITDTHLRYRRLRRLIDLYQTAGKA